MPIATVWLKRNLLYNSVQLGSEEMRFALFAITTLVLLGIEPSTAAPPLELKGINPGVTTRADMRAWPQDRYLYVNCPLDAGSYLVGADVCSVRIKTLAGRKVESAAIFFVNSIVMAAEATVSTADATIIADEFGKKYGAPTEMKTSAQNVFGAIFSGKISIWKRGDVTLMVDTLGTTAGLGKVIIMNDRMQRERAAHERIATKPEDDL